MRNRLASSVLIAVLIAAAVVGLAGVSAANAVSSTVNPLDANVTVDTWRAAYVQSVAWSALVTACAAALWLVMAHSGRGLDTKAGLWYLLWFVAIFASAALAWLIPPAVREGPLHPMIVNGVLGLFGYWVATFFMAPDHYRFTPLLARVIWGQRRT